MADAVPFYLQEPVDPITKLGLANYLQTQSAAPPINQAQINQAVINQNEPAMPIRAPAQADPRALKALQHYLPPKPMAKAASDEQIDAYTGLSEKSLADQQATLAGLNQYIDSIAQKPQGLNLTPIAAFIDSYTGSKLAPAAQALAPMSADEKDKMLFGLRNQLATGQEKLSNDRLQATQYAQTMRRQMAHDAEQARHNAAMEANQSARGDGMMIRGQVAKDNQTAAAVDKVANDAQLKSYIPRIQGADRILGQLGEVRAGKIVDTRQFLNDLNTEYVNLLTQSNNSALGKQERTEYGSYAADLAAVRQKVEASPQSINSPALLNQLEKSVQSLQKTYHANYDQRADLLKRNYRYNPDATEQQARQVELQKSQYGSAAYHEAEQPSKIRVSNGKETRLIDVKHLKDAQADGYAQVK